MGIVMEAGRTALDSAGCAASRRISVVINVFGATWIHIRWCFRVAIMEDLANGDHSSRAQREWQRAVHHRRRTGWMAHKSWVEAARVWSSWLLEINCCAAKASRVVRGEASSLRTTLRPEFGFK
ncbi:hypothetical protein EJB05_15824, partial [Eragrostis curvula]